MVSNIAKESAKPRSQRSRNGNRGEMAEKPTEQHWASDSRPIHDHQGTRQMLNSRHHCRKKATWLPGSQELKFKHSEVKHRANRRPGKAPESKR